MGTNPKPNDYRINDGLRLMMFTLNLLIMGFETIWKDHGDDVYLHIPSGYD